MNKEQTFTRCKKCKHFKFCFNGQKCLKVISNEPLKICGCKVCDYNQTTRAYRLK